MIDAVTQSQGGMPEPRRLDLPLLPTGQEERYYLERFMGAFGAGPGETALVDDPVATWREDRPVLAVARDLFTSHAGKSKLKKAGREVFMLYIAATIQAPDEVWMVGTGQEGATMTRLARFRMGRDLLNVLAVYRRGAKVWSGVTAYQTYDGTYFNSKRTGNLCYRR